MANEKEKNEIDNENLARQQRFQRIAEALNEAKRRNPNITPEELTKQSMALQEAQEEPGLEDPLLAEALESLIPGLGQVKAGIAGGKLALPMLMGALKSGFKGGAREMMEGAAKKGATEGAETLGKLGVREIEEKSLEQMRNLPMADRLKMLAAKRSEGLEKVGLGGIEEAGQIGEKSIRRSGPPMYDKPAGVEPSLKDRMIEMKSKVPFGQGGAKSTPPQWSQMDEMKKLAEESIEKQHPKLEDVSEELTKKLPLEETQEFDEAAALSDELMKKIRRERGF